ncbi:MAG TPA: TlpA disulfide reductase family protein [Kofleriaceae bacterium]|nr:TlpA disulfide reductase family protein [Kofleriaceae bacterium]
MPGPHHPARLASAVAAWLLVATLIACTRPAPVSPGEGDEAYRSVVSRRGLDGKPVGHDQAASATVVIVFASWCQACRKELAMLSELVTEHPRVRVIGVNAFEDFEDLSNAAALEEFLGTNHPWLTVVRGDDQLLRSLGGVSKIPTLFVFDAHGAAVKVYRPERRTPPGKKELMRVLTGLHG